MEKRPFLPKKLPIKNLSNIFREHRLHIITLLAAGVFSVWIGLSLFSSPLQIQKEVVIKEGQSVDAIGEVLKENGIIKSKSAFVIYTLITGNERKLQAGRYLFQPGVTVLNIIYAMASGFAEKDDVIVTIPEGFNIWEIDERLAGAGLITEGEFARKYYTEEGQFFPDTYRFSKKDETIDTIAEKMKNHLNLKFQDLSLVFSSLVLRDTLTRASILEKEARKPEDMRLVAGVIKNRLARRMPLQIDATVSYGACLRTALANDFKKNCDVSQVPVGAEIRIDSPYNSYRRSGLPPGPIANPGIQAIEAVLDPQESDYLYYLSTRDGSQMIFSKTAAEHVANRRKYLGL